ncbi:MAG: hypothetical protein ACKPCP_33385, partial [Sphaerospermopsis kisseleviana]
MVSVTASPCMVDFFGSCDYIVTATLPTSVDGSGMGCPSSFNTSRYNSKSATLFLVGYHHKQHIQVNLEHKLFLPKLYSHPN